MLRYDQLTPMLLATLLGGFIATAGAETPVVEATQNDLMVQEQNGVSYLSGGISDTGQEMIREQAGDFNLEVLSALEEGNYLSEVSIRIADAKGNTVLSTVTEGPFLYADLAPGTYTIMANVEGELQRQTATVNNSQQTRVNFRW